MSNHGWIGVDLDGTLAHYDGWKGIEHIGAPVPKMVERIKRWRAEGKRVKIFTARACDRAAIPYIQKYCFDIFGEAFDVTNVKDYEMVELWDDRAQGVVFNEGTIKRSDTEYTPQSLHE